jgi:hypothetical protein
MINSSTIVIVLIIAVVLFFVLRELNCWYWKINKRVDLLEKQNSLLEKILTQLTGKPSTEIPPEIKIKPNDISNSFISNLSDEEKREFDRFINQGVQLGEKIAINKRKRKFDRFSRAEWENIVKSGHESEWQILFEK